MPLTNVQRQAIRAAASRQLAGNPVETTDRGFWSQFGLPSQSQRLDLLSRANALAEASLSMNAELTGESIGDLFAGTGYPAGEGGGGPLDQSSGTVFARVPFYKGNRVQWRSVSITLSFDASIEDVLSELHDTISEFEGFYDIGEADLAGIDFFVY